MTIHDSHPFPTPSDPVRRLRGRLGGAVSLWTAGSDGDRAGLTVSSLMVAGGDPGRVLGLVDPDSDLRERVEEHGRAVVQLLQPGQSQVAEAFAGTTPAPGGPFRTSEFEQTAWGPRVVAVSTWAGVRLESVVGVGWSDLLTCVIEHLEIGEDEPLEHRRGRYGP